MVLDASLLNTQHYKVRIKGKVEQSREGVAPSPTPWCSSYRKGSLRVTLDYGRQLYLLIYIYIYIYIYIQDFVFINPARLICHKTQPNQVKPNPSHDSSGCRNSQLIHSKHDAFIFSSLTQRIAFFKINSIFQRGMVNRFALAPILLLIPTPARIPSLPQKKNLIHLN